jgi:nucleoporin NUP82
MAIAGDQTPDGTMSDDMWLDRLPSHPIFSFASTLDDEINVVAMAIRNTDVLVARGNELRMASLLEVKHGGDGASNHSIRSYRRLRASKLDFAIEILIVNPTGKLLAVVGSHQVVVVVLPRSGALTHGLQGTSAMDTVVDINVKAAAVGSFYHHVSLGNRARIAGAQWHPWGSVGKSLLIMTRDGVLREYDAEDVEEPAQTLYLFDRQQNVDAGPVYNLGDESVMHDRLRHLRSRSRSQTPIRSLAGDRARRSTSRLAFDDNSDSGDETMDNDFDKTFHTASGSLGNMGTKDRKVVSFTLALDLRSTAEEEKTSTAHDWSPLTVYALCSTGDVYALCPFLPKEATIPSSYLHSLASFVRLHQTSIANADVDDVAEAQSNATAARFVAALLKEASSQRSTRVRASTPQKPRRAMSATPMSVDLDDEMERHADEMDDLVNVRNPVHISQSQPVAQGPFLLTPAPHELSEDREANATDIFFAHYTEGKTAGVNVIGIASDDGRVDICLALDPVRPRWLAERSVSRTRSQASRKTGRYALSDSEDEEDQQSLNAINATANAMENLPTLLVYETIDLDLLSIAGDSFEAKENFLSRSAVRLLLDPLYPDTVYVRHTAGVHAIRFGRWANDLATVLQAGSTTEGNMQLQRMLHQSTPSDVIFLVSTIAKNGQQGQPNPITSVCVVTDIYLCYSLLALASSGSLIALELSLRVEDDSIYEDAREGDVSRIFTSKALEDEKETLYSSLLDQTGGAFDAPDLFKPARTAPSLPKTIARANGQAELRVTPDTLRTLASTVQTLRGRVRDIVHAGNTVQARLELQMEELKRQLGKIAQIHDRLNKGQQSKSIAGRVKAIMERQTTIAKRSDRLLQRLIESHSPELSAQEINWLAEMQRLEAQLGAKQSGADTEDDTISSRMQALRHQIEQVKRQVEERERDGGDTTNEQQAPMFSTKQLRDVEAMLAAQSQVLDSDRTKILHLNTLVRRHVRGVRS